MLRQKSKMKSGNKTIYNPRGSWEEAEIFLYRILGLGYHPHDIEMQIADEIPTAKYDLYRYKFLRDMSRMLKTLYERRVFDDLLDVNIWQSVLVNAKNEERLKFEKDLKSRLRGEVPQGGFYALVMDIITVQERRGMYFHCLFTYTTLMSLNRCEAPSSLRGCFRVNRHNAETCCQSH